MGSVWRASGLRSASRAATCGVSLAAFLWPATQLNAVSVASVKRWVTHVLTICLSHTPPPPDPEGQGVRLFLVLEAGGFVEDAHLFGLPLGFRILLLPVYWGVGVYLPPVIPKGVAPFLRRAANLACAFGLG